MGLWWRMPGSYRSLTVHLVSSRREIRRDNEDMFLTLFHYARSGIWNALVFSLAILLSGVQACVLLLVVREKALAIIF